MKLSTDTSDPNVDRYTGSAIWERRSSFLFRLIVPDNVALQYSGVQIVNGDGALLEPAYSDFVEAVKTTYDNRIYFYGLQEERVGDFLDCFPWV